MEENKKTNIDIKGIIETLWAKRCFFVKVWIITFILSCIWILPQPRYYTTKVSIAPESPSSSIHEGLSSLASNLGFNLGGTTTDAIYPQLYPELFESTQFLVGLFDIKIITNKGDLKTDYYTYIKNHQKENPLFWPINVLQKWLEETDDQENLAVHKIGERHFSPFKLSKKEWDVLKNIKSNLKCKYNKATDVVTIEVTDQDPLVCALMADSIKEHLQEFITRYRTNKARTDYQYYKDLTTKAKHNYDRMLQRYGAFADSNTKLALESVRLKAEQMENELEISLNTYSTLKRQLDATQARIQEQTPAFTTLRNATVPIKPAGPKRMIFVGCMLILSTIVYSALLIKKNRHKIIY